MTHAQVNLYGEFVSLRLSLDKDAFLHALGDWTPAKADELRLVIRERFGDDHFTTPSIQHALSVLRDWPLDCDTQEVLIALGNTDFSSPDSIQERLETIRTYYWYLMAGYPDLSFSCLNALAADTGAALIRGITIAEEHGYSRYRGSVSLVCHAFRRFQSYGLPAWAPLADWIVGHTTNPYIPFNFRRTRAQWEAWRNNPCDKPEDIWIRVCEAEATRAREKQERERADKEAVIARRAARRHEHAQRTDARLRRRDIRNTILSTFQLLSPVERLEHIISDTEHPITFYPDEFAILAPSALNAISPSLRVAVVNRLSDRRKGVWRKLRDELEKKA